MPQPKLFTSMAAIALIAGAAVAQTGANQAASNSSSTAAPGAKPNELLDAQVMLDVAGFSPGTIDGKHGSSMTKAVRGFQQANGLTVTGKLDEKTKTALQKFSRPGSIMVKLTNDDVGGPFTYPMPKKPEDQAKLDALNYRNMLEKLAERYHTTPEAIVEMNGPEKLIGVGQELLLPNVVPASRNYDGAMDKQGALLNELNVPGDVPKGDYIVVDKSEGTLKVYKGEFPSGKTAPTDGGQLIAQFPVTTGSGHDPLPLGNWKVPTFSFLPPFNYQPDLFWDVSDEKAEHKLPPGPNGMVGVAWLDLTKEHYGIHGTPEPRWIGKTESHGCLRLTNWDVMRLSRMMKPGFQAKFVA